VTAAVAKATADQRLIENLRQLGRLDWHCIAPGKPVQKAFVESFNSCAKNALMSMYP
jgi:Integrase core domain